MMGVDGTGLCSVRTGKAAACVACCFLLNSRAILNLGMIQSHPCHISEGNAWDNSRRAVTPQPSLPSTEAVISPSCQTRVVEWEYANPYRTYNHCGQDQKLCSSSLISCTAFQCRWSAPIVRRYKPSTNQFSARSSHPGLFSPSKNKHSPNDLRSVDMSRLSSHGASRKLSGIPSLGSVDLISVKSKSNIGPCSLTSRSSSAWPRMAAA